MLKKRSRAVSSGSSSKQALMSESPSLPSPTANHNKTFPSPRLFVGLSPKVFSDTESAAMSPTSILETKPFSAIGNPFFSDRNPPRKPLPDSTESKHHPWENGESKHIGLGIVDAFKKTPKPERRMVLFGSQLKIQIPTSIGSEESPQSPIEFGIKNKNSQLALLSPARRSSSNLGSELLMASSPRVFTGCLSATEMELSEDYTCVIAHGPNPRTTHIFDNCIVESCGNGFISSSKKEKHPSYPWDDFLTFCHACKKSLGQGTDIFMYRGEKAFCSRECRHQEMMFDEGIEECPGDPFATL